MSVQDKGKRSHLSCQMTARRASGQSEARVVLLGTGRSGDWTTWRATARQQRVKMNSCSATGNTHFHTHSHTKSSFLHIWLIVFLWSSTLKLRGWGFWSVRCRWWWGGRWRCGQRRGQLREWVPRQTGIETCAKTPTHKDPTQGQETAETAAETLLWGRGGRDWRRHGWVSLRDWLFKLQFIVCFKYFCFLVIYSRHYTLYGCRHFLTFHRMKH